MIADKKKLVRDYPLSVLRLEDVNLVDLDSGSSEPALVDALQGWTEFIPGDYTARYSSDHSLRRVGLLRLMS